MYHLVAAKVLLGRKERRAIRAIKVTKEREVLEEGKVSVVVSP